LGDGFHKNDLPQSCKETKILSGENFACCRMQEAAGVVLDRRRANKSRTNDDSICHITIPTFNFDEATGSTFVFPAEADGWPIQFPCYAPAHS
jgi:hypothetical protein